MADALTQFWQGLGNLLTGNQQQQPISSSQGQSSGQTPTQAPAMPQQPGGLEGWLNNPAVQGGLATYFSLLAQPKVGGWGRGLGNAGLSGLQAYEGARAEQAKLPLEQAQLGQAQAETKLKGAEVGQKEAETQFYQQHPEAAGYKYAPEFQKSQQRELAAQQFEQKAVVDPVNAGQWRTAATLVRSGEDPDKAMTAAFTDPTVEAKLKTSEVQKNIATTKMLEGGGRPTILDVGGMPMAVTPTGAKPIPGIGKGTSVGRLGSTEADAAKRQAAEDKITYQGQQEYDKEYKLAQAAFAKAHPSHLGGLMGGYTIEDQEAYAQSKGEEARQRFLARAHAGVAGTGTGASSTATPTAPLSAATGTHDIDVNEGNPPADAKLVGSGKGKAGRTVNEYRMSDGSYVYFYAPGK